MKSGRIHKSKTIGRYTIIPNSVLENNTLTLRAIGLLCYLLKLPPDWVVHKSKLHNQMRDGRDAVMSAFSELEEAKYIICETSRGKGGRFSSFDYFVYDTPFTGNQEMVTGKPDTVKPFTENPVLQSTILTKENNTKENTIAPTGAIQLLFDPEREYKKLGKSKQSICGFIKEHRPNFIDPYKDLWNMFAEEKKLPQVKAINKTRKAKFLVRIKEKEFDFLLILKKAAISEFCLAANWFGFDWLLENDENYLRVLEGKYDNKKGTVKNNVATSTTGPKAFPEIIKYLLGRYVEGQFDDRLILPEYYDKLVTHNELPSGTMVKYPAETIDQQKILAVKGFLESKSKNLVNLQQ